MPDGTPTAPPARAGGRLAAWALGLSVAAALSCWNPFAAPLGLVVGAAAAALAVAVLRRPPGRKALAVAALVLGLGAAVASGAVLLATAGAVTAELPGEPVVRGRTEAEAGALLDEAAKRTEASRRRALRELEKGTGRLAPAGTAKDGAWLSPADAVPGTVPDAGPGDAAADETE